MRQEECCVSTWIYPDFVISLDDSKSSSPEPVTHLKWDDPYYDIARHQIVEVAGEHAQLCTFFLMVCAPGLKKLTPHTIGEEPGGHAGVYLWFHLRPWSSSAHVPFFKKHGLDCDCHLIRSPIAAP